MIRTHRPTSGRLVFLVFATSLSLSVVACGKKEVGQDSWRMTPPTVEVANAKDANLKTLHFNVANSKPHAESFSADDTAVLRFATGDIGLAMKVKSSCESDGANKAETEKTAEFSASLVTFETVSLLAIMPPAILRPDALSKPWMCRMQVRVSNAAGSTHEFKIDAFRLNLAIPQDRLNLFAEKLAADSTGPKNVSSRRLVCPSWWVDAPVTVDLADAARSETVGGVDSRETERQPLCSVLELGSRSQLIGFFKPNLGGARLAWTTEVRVVRSRLPHVLQLPLLAWNIRNDGNFPQIAFIPNKTAVRVSILQHFGPSTAWSPANNVYASYVHNAQEFRETTEGLYLKIAAKATVRIELNGTRGNTICSYSPSAPNRLKISADAPLTLSTLANTNNLPPLSTINPVTLDQIPRDLTAQPERAVLLATLIAKADAETYVATALTDLQLPGIDGIKFAEFCIDGTIFPVFDMSQTLSPLAD